MSCSGSVLCQASITNQVWVLDCARIPIKTRFLPFSSRFSMSKNSPRPVKRLSSRLLHSGCPRLDSTQRPLNKLCISCVCPVLRIETQSSTVDLLTKRDQKKYTVTILGLSCLETVVSLRPTRRSRHLWLSSTIVVLKRQDVGQRTTSLLSKAQVSWHPKLKARSSTYQESSRDVLHLAQRFWISNQNQQKVLLEARRAFNFLDQKNVFLHPLLSFKTALIQTGWFLSKTGHRPEVQGRKDGAKDEGRDLVSTGPERWGKPARKMRGVLHGKW